MCQALEIYHDPQSVSALEKFHGGFRTWSYPTEDIERKLNIAESFSVCYVFEDKTVIRSGPPSNQPTPVLFYKDGLLLF